MWTDFFDAIYVVNLEERLDRRLEIEMEMNKYGINFEYFDAIKHEQGIVGLLKSMKKLFEECIEKRMANVLIFEDDCVFLNNPNEVMPKCLEQLPRNYLMFNLGYNLMNKPVKISPNLFKITSSYATHAVAYSYEGMKMILEILDEQTAYDILLMKNIQPLGRCYGSFPVLCSQKNGYSDIENKDMEWGKLMAISYRMFTGEFI